MKKLILTLVGFCMASVICWGSNPSLALTDSPTDFPLDKATIYYSPSDAELVGIAANLLKDDIYSVTDRKVKAVCSDKVKGRNVVVIGTVENNPFIRSLSEEGKLDIQSIAGDWERYIIATVDNPTQGIDRALIIAGSDRRGAAYGTFALSETIGVSPLYWWTDVPATKHKNLYIAPVNYTSTTPSVKYRGIFINDEGWGFGPWSQKTFEPELGVSGPKTYAKVCELLLRMKGNMLAPAMHPSTMAFNRVAENKVVADRYGIVMTTSHCEPLHYNNTTEWDSKTHGQWNFIENRDGINSVLEQRVKEVAPYENSYVLCARGIHDAGMIGVPEDQKVMITERALQDQRDLLAKYVDTPIEEIPQVFVPYKEVLEIYEKGMQLPPEVTIVWPDDNFGYIKRLNNDFERQRPGGSGVYYHISYLGEPHDYLWLNTTPTTLIFEEMRKAYDSGAQRYWLLNVGDIKPGELGMKFFLDMAWDVDKYNFDNAYTYVPEFLSETFGREYYDDLLDIMSSYYLLGFQRKPEAMGWGIQWNQAFAQERMTDTDFSMTNYREAEKRLEEYERIADKAQQIMESLPMEKRDAFFEMVYYPLKGASLMNHKMLLAQKSRWYARQNRAATPQVAQQARQAYDSIAIITEQYNSLKNGKWRNMMALAPGWVATYQNMPPVGELGSVSTSVNANTSMMIFVPGKDFDYATGNVSMLPVQAPYSDKDESFMEIYNISAQPFGWSATSDNAAVTLSENTGEITTEKRIGINIDWANVPEGYSSANIKVNCAGNSNNSGNSGNITNGEALVIVPLFKPSKQQMAQAEGCFIETNGTVSFPAGKYMRCVSSGTVVPKCVKGLGYESDCLQLGKPFDTMEPSRDLNKRAHTEYDFYTFTGGSATVDVYALPVFPLNKESDVRYGVQIDDGIIQWMGAPSKEYSTSWKLNVIKNSAASTLTLNLDQPGRHTLKLYCVDPGMVLQKVVIDLGGERRSYLGAPVSPLIQNSSTLALEE